ncbi:unnamed protein product, partial [marine sediment metagenome]
MAGIRQTLFEGMKDFDTHADGLRACVGGDRHDHEFLNINWIISMGTAIDDVHHRHRQSARASPAHKTWC